MLTQEIITYLLGVAALVSIILTVWNALRKPQEQGEINDKVFDEKFRNLSEKLDLLKNNDLHEIKGIMNTHISNQNIYEREVTDKIARLDTKLESLIKK